MSQRSCDNVDNEDRCEVLAISMKGTTAFAEPLTPLCDQYNDQMRIDSRVTTHSDEEIVESLYQNVFSLVLCLQIEESGHGSHTPDSAYCPGAPMKLTKLARTLDPGFQRKLF